MSLTLTCLHIFAPQWGRTHNDIQKKCNDNINWGNKGALKTFLNRLEMSIDLASSSRTYIVMCKSQCYNISTQETNKKIVKTKFYITTTLGNQFWPFWKEIRAFNLQTLFIHVFSSSCCVLEEIKLISLNIKFWFLEPTFLTPKINTML